MKTVLQFLGLEAQDSWRRLVQQQLNDLELLTAVTAAEVTLERQPRERPGFQVHVKLDASGHNFSAKAAENTRQAALLKATEDLERQIRAREFKRTENQKSWLTAGASSSRESSVT